MLLRLSFALVLTFLLADRACGQCTPSCAEPCACPSNPPAGICIVHSEPQLRDALSGTSSCTNCSGGIPAHIKVPAGVQICLDEEIVLDLAHEGLRLTIDGTLTWNGDAGASDSRIITIESTSGITIDGIGLLNTIYEAASGDPPGSDFPNGTATAIFIYNSQDIIVQGTGQSSPLRFSNVTNMIEIVSDGTNKANYAAGIILRHLDAEELSWYGVFANSLSTTVEDCHVHAGANGGTCYHQHGFRFYSHDVVLRDCSAYDIPAKQGFWHVAGHNFIIDGFMSDQDCWLGPNSTADWGCIPPDQEEASLTDGNVRNLNVVKLEFFMGSRAINVTNLCTDLTFSTDSLYIAHGFDCYPDEFNVCPDCPPICCFECPLNRPHQQHLLGQTERECG